MVRLIKELNQIKFVWGGIRKASPEMTMEPVTKAKILVVDDEADILELVRYNLAKQQYRVIAVMSGEDALRNARDVNPDLILLDLMLPGIDGLDVCKILKSNQDTQAIPIIMLTAKGEEADIILGLELGADDYMTKPFSPRVLLARIKAVLKRSRQQAIADETAVIRIGELSLIPDKFEARCENKPINLTATEYRILHYLIRHPGWVFTRYQIVDAVRGENYPVTERSVDVHIVSLRKKLGKMGDFVETVRGVGYRFRDE
jgi:two-component system, OmpR family, alkaline phosphatase synthesis response regulator PhoP